jgi:hypothetical protein
LRRGWITGAFTIHDFTTTTIGGIFAQEALTQVEGNGDPIVSIGQETLANENGYKG